MVLTYTASRMALELVMLHLLLNLVYLLAGISGPSMDPEVTALSEIVLWFLMKVVNPLHI